MQPRWHILFGFIFSYILIYFFGYSSFAGLIVFLSSIFIDLDHVLLYFIEKKNLHPKKFFDWSEKKKLVWESLAKEEKNKFKSPQFILHGVEFILFLGILSFFNIFFFWILIGIILHLILDFLILFFEMENYHFSLKSSQVWVWHRNKNKKKFFI